MSTGPLGYSNAVVPTTALEVVLLVVERKGIDDVVVRDHQMMRGTQTRPLQNSI